MSNQKAEAHTKRKNYFIDRSFQTKFILKFCGLVLCGGLLTIGILYLFSMKSTTVMFLNARIVVKNTAEFLLPVLIQTVAIVMVVISIGTIFVTLFMSHKIAGPLHSFKKTMKTLEEGDFSRDFKIRNLDQLKDLASSFNVMIAKTRMQLKAIKESGIFLKQKLDTLSESEVDKNKRTDLAELKKAYKELNNLIDYFKI